MPSCLCSVLMYPPYLRTINTLWNEHNTKKRYWHDAQLFMLRSSVSSFLPKDYQYAVKRTQYKVALLVRCPVVYAPF